jgi:SAM-dependent methyltransferase
MRTSVESEDLGLNVPSGQKHYRAFVGPPADYDLVAAMSFNLLTLLGLRQHHRLLDIGCGSLRIGRLLIPYLNRGCYTGLDPNPWLIEEGIRREVGADQVAIKQAQFVHAESGRGLRKEGRTFDYALAQSIFSHCGPDLLSHWLEDCSSLLEPTGALIATYVRATADTERQGWIYPECVGLTQETVAAAAVQAGLHFAPLDWHHPRQSWAIFAKEHSPLRTLDQPLTWNARFGHIDAAQQPA